MSRGGRKLRRSAVPVTSTMAMIDVIFILFAFFLSVSQIRKSTVKVELPEVSDAVATGDRTDETEPLRYVIILGRTDSDLDDASLDAIARRVAGLLSEEPADPAAARRKLSAMFGKGLFGFGKETFHTKEALFDRIGRQIEADSAADRPLVVEIIADRRADNGSLVDLINFLSRRGVRRLEFLAVEKAPIGGR